MERSSNKSSRSSRSNDEESSLWKNICSSLNKLEGIQKDEEGVLNSINKIQFSLNIKEGITTTIQQKLKDNYRRGIELSCNETKVIQDIIEKISILVAIKESNETEQEHHLKKRKKSSKEDELTMNGSGSTQILSRGTTVAARQKDNKNEEWILAIVLNYFADKNKYQVEDVDQDDFGQKQRYMLSPRYVIPVKSSQEAASFPILPTHKDVLALYPGTTCFYKATIIAPPSKSKEIKNYRVQFDDDNDEVKYISPEHVLEMPSYS